MCAFANKRTRVSNSILKLCLKIDGTLPFVLSQYLRFVAKYLKKSLVFLLAYLSRTRARSRGVDRQVLLTLASSIVIFSNLTLDSRLPKECTIMAHIHSFFTRILFFPLRQNILIFLGILG